MKKIFCTLSFVALLSIAGKAQSNQATDRNGAKNDKANAEIAMPQDAAPAEKASKDAEPAPKTRMAINEKGVPASKTTAKDKPVKQEKTATTKQPVNTEKKQ